MSNAVPGRRERKKQAIRDKICEETLALIEHHGIDGTTIDAICDCADIAKKTFYNYYSSKHDLMIDICQTKVLNRTGEMIDEAIAQNNDLAEQLAYVFSVMHNRATHIVHSDKELINYMVGSLAENRSQGAGQLTFMNECFLRLYQNSADAIKPGLTPSFCAEMTVGMVNSLTLNWLHSDDYDTDVKYRQLSEYVISSMLKQQ